MTMEYMNTFWIIILFLLFGFCQTDAYRKYYVEDECVSPNDFQKVVFKLPPTGPDSVGEVRSNRFGTYSRTGRKCLIKLIPPKGFGVLVTILRVDFRNQGGCKDYIKILDEHNSNDRLCNYIETDGKTYFSDSEMRILYHTVEGGMGFSNGIRLVFTVTKLDVNSTECSAPDDFMCTNTHCIWAGVQCDGINNCGDSSDENSMEHPHCNEVTPLAIAAVILGITSLIAVLILICLCYCRPSARESSFEDFPRKSNGGYMPLPGYTYDNLGYSYQHPFSSQGGQPSAPLALSSSYPPPGIPYFQSKCNHAPPPPYMVI